MPETFVLNNPTFGVRRLFVTELMSVRTNSAAEAGYLPDPVSRDAALEQPVEAI